MKSMVATVAKVLGFALVFLVAACSPASPQGEASSTPVAVGVDIKAGEYLANAGLCAWCHTPISESGQLDTTKLFAGGRKFDVEGVGTVYAPNITQDQETGIGRWTDAEIMAAFFGIGRNGEKQAPPMPFFGYAYLSTKDKDDLVGYLRTVPPIRNQIPRSSIDRTQFPPLPRARGSIKPPTEGLSRGRFVAQAIATCGLCHTPMRDIYNVENTRELTGARIPFAPNLKTFNLTPEEKTGLGGWKAEEIIAAVRDGKGKNGRPLHPLMPSVAYKNLSPKDLELLVQFLQSLSPQPSSIP